MPAREVQLMGVSWRYVARAAGNLAVAVACSCLPAAHLWAAETGESCCADLDQRVAELEDTVARATRKGVSVRISGHVNRIITFWDDGEESNAYVSDTSTWSSRFRLTGLASATPDWIFGYRLELAVADGLSSNLNQIDSNAFRGGLKVARSYYFIDNKQLGRLSVGLQQEANDGATGGGDFSGLESQSGSGLTDNNGGFFLRRKGVPGGAGLVRELTWADISLEAPGDGASERNVVRYDSPTFGGFRVAWSWGVDDDWTAAGYFSREFGDFRVGASIGYGAYTSPLSDCRQRVPFDPSSKNCTALGGGIGFIHVPTGILAHYSTGIQFDDFHAPPPLRDPNDQTWFYAKAGIHRQFISLGHSGIFGEYYRGSRTLEELFPSGTSSLAPGDVFVRGSTVDFFGVSAYQDIDSAATQIYLTYRNFGADLDVLDPNTFQRIPAPIDRFQALILGVRIEF
jgi:hypothetical protein